MQIAELICPVCRLKLVRFEGTLKCASGHSYDEAREGYVNLVTGKAPRATQGDNVQMVRARRAFLRRGYYQPLVVELRKILTGINHESGPLVLADIGCGEGYYLGELTGESKHTAIRAYGTDISKSAIRLGAKTYPNVCFAVADTNDLIPLASAGVDVCLNIFAPRNAAEFARIVRPGGLLVVVIPTQDHLASLRERFGLLDIESGKLAKITSQLTGFDLTNSQSASGSIRLDGPSASDLVAMTPSARHVDPEALERLAQVRDLTTEASFQVLVFSRRGQERGEA
jgi:23S rRNA (guanine745-N1)-methyltransferase